MKKEIQFKKKIDRRFLVRFLSLVRKKQYIRKRNARTPSEDASRLCVSLLRLPFLLIFEGMEDTDPTTQRSSKNKNLSIFDLKKRSFRNRQTDVDGRTHTVHTPLLFVVVYLFVNSFLLLIHY